LNTDKVFQMWLLYQKSLLLACYLLVGIVGSAFSWDLFTSDDGRFSVQLPPNPEYESDVIDTDVGELVLNMYTADCTVTVFT